MRQLFLSISSIATLVGTGIAAFASLQIVQQTNCKNPVTNLELKECAYKDYQEADKKLNEIYQQLVSQLDSQRRQKLVAAEEAWIQFRDLTCDFQSSAFEGGTIQPVIHYGCLTELTQEQTERLKKSLEQQ